MTAELMIAGTTVIVVATVAAAIAGLGARTMTAMMTTALHTVIGGAGGGTVKFKGTRAC